LQVLFMCDRIRRPENISIPAKFAAEAGSTHNPSDAIRDCISRIWGSLAEIIRPPDSCAASSIVLCAVMWVKKKGFRICYYYFMKVKMGIERDDMSDSASGKTIRLTTLSSCAG
jgi:hypothetical protein